MYKCDCFNNGDFFNKIPQQMNLTEQHIEILERHKHYWDSLNVAGFMRNLDRSVFDELQTVHNEALTITHFSAWCGECVADMVRIIYVNYEKWKEQQPATATPATTPIVTLTRKEKRKQNQNQNQNGEQHTPDSDNRP